MSRLWPDGEPIAMHTDAQGRPVHFTWRGQLHRLGRIHQRWQVDVDWWHSEGRVWREYLAVTTSAGLLCVIYRDLERQSWHLAKLYD